MNRHEQNQYTGRSEYVKREKAIFAMETCPFCEIGYPENIGLDFADDSSLFVKERCPKCDRTWTVEFVPYRLLDKPAT